MDSDFMPNKKNTDYYQPFDDTEKKREQSKERAEVITHLSVLEEIIARFDERIAFYDSLNSIEDDVVADQVLLAQTVHANKLTAQNLTAERDAIKTLINDHK